MNDPDRGGPARVGPALGRRDRILALLLAALTAAVWATFLDKGIDLSDEGSAAVSGARLARGQAPFVDFFTFYFPGHPLFVAGAFRLLGESVLSARLAWALFAVARTPLVYLVARRLAPAPAAAAAAAVALLLPGPSWKVQVATLFLLGLWTALRYGERPGPARAVAVGVAAGFATWFRWDTGAAGAAALAVAAGFAWRAGRRAPRALAGDAAAFAAAALAVLLPGLAWLAWTPGAIDGLVEHFRYHARSVEAFALPWPSPLPGLGDPPADVAQALRRALYSLPVLGLAALALARFGAPERRPAAVAVFAVALPAYLLAVRRPDPSHFLQVLCVALLPLLALRPRGRPARAVAALLLALAAAGLVSEASRAGGARRPTLRLALADTVALSMERARVRVRPAVAREIEAVVAEIRRRTAPGDPIAVLPVEIMVQFLADRPPALRYNAIYPVLLEDRGRQARAAAELRRARLVLVRPMRHGFGGPGSPTPREFAPLLFETLRAHFRPAGAVGRFLIYEPRDPP